MTLKGKLFALAIISVLVAGGISAYAAMQEPGREHDPGPAYSLEGAWYGMTSIAGVPPTPTLDTFAANAQRHGVEGTFLCTIPAAFAGGETPSAHGNWVRIGKNKYAFTALRAMMNGATPIGWGKFWGTITAVSRDELTGTINAQLFDLGGTPISPQFPGTLERHRIEITFEQ
jgi:hypothetical protein